MSYPDRGDDRDSKSRRLPRRCTWCPRDLRKPVGRCCSFLRASAPWRGSSCPVWWPGWGSPAARLHSPGRLHRQTTRTTPRISNRTRPTVLAQTQRTKGVIEQNKADRTVQTQQSELLNRRSPQYCEDLTYKVSYWAERGHSTVQTQHTKRVTEQN